MKNPGTSVRVLNVPSISCHRCRNAIEYSVGDVKGLDALNVDIDPKTVTVAGGAEADIVEAIDRAGYGVV